MFKRKPTRDAENQKYIENLFAAEQIDLPNALSPEQIGCILDGQTPRRMIRWQKYAALAAAAVVCVVSVSAVLWRKPLQTQMPTVQATSSSAESKTVLEPDSEVLVELNPSKAQKDSKQNEASDDYSRLYEIVKKNAKTDNNVHFTASATVGTSGETAMMDAGAPKTHSETNLQESNVDEADILKTDGKHLYAVYASKVVLVAPNNGNMKIAGQIKLGAAYTVKELYLSKNRLTVIASHPDPDADEDDVYVTCGAYDSLYGADGLTDVFYFDVSNAKKPKQLYSYTQDGCYMSSRMTDGCLYLVTEDSLRRKGVKKKKIETYVPGVMVDGEKSYLPADRIYYASSTASPRYQTIYQEIVLLSGVNLTTKDRVVEQSGYLGYVDDIYATEHNIYLYSTSYANDSAGETTDIYRYAISNGKPAFAATGTVEGYVSNTFCLDEQKPYLRVATTRTKKNTTVNTLTVLDADLEKVGKLDDLAEGETIFASRIIGDTAYLVTYEQVDPLFVISLKNPKSPKVLGKLKIPGFSDYLHPIGNGLMLGIGQQDDYAKVSLFDVSDPNKPKEIDKQIIKGKKLLSGASMSTTAASEDHKAFTAFDGSYYIPLVVDSDDDSVTSVLRIQIENRKLSMAFSEDAGGDFYWMQRIAVVGDHIYACFADGMVSYSVQGLKRQSKLYFGMKNVGIFSYLKDNGSNQYGYFAGSKVKASKYAAVRPDKAVKSYDTAVAFAVKAYKHVMHKSITVKEVDDAYVDYDEYEKMWKVNLYSYRNEADLYLYFNDNGVIQAMYI